MHNFSIKTYSSFIDEIDKKYFKLAVGANLGKESNTDISAKCPVCGDSSSKNTKRLHLYIKNGTSLVHCFNGDCAVHNNMYNFLKIYYPDLLHSYKRERFNKTLNEMTSEFNGYGDINIHNTPSKIEISPLKTTVISDYTLNNRFIPMTQDCLDFLEMRNIQPRENWYYSPKDLTIDGVFYKTKNSIIIPLYKNNQMYGFYSRNITEKIFATWIPECNSGYKIWNFFDIDKEIPTFIFEGIFDALSSGKKNIIALMGSTIPSDRLNEIKQPIFCLDNDKTGNIQALKYLEVRPDAGIFIFPDEFYEKDLNETLKRYTSQEISDFISENIYFGIRAKVKLKMRL